MTITEPIEPSVLAAPPSAKKNSFTNSFVNLAKTAYDRYPGLAKKLGIFDLLSIRPYRPYYMKRINQKMEEFLGGGMTVEFEVTNKCNADCIMCPNSIMERPIVKMDMDLFKRIVDEFAAENLPLIKFVFAGIGEPTLDPLLPEKIRYLKEKIPAVPVQLTTNASLLTERRAYAPRGTRGGLDGSAGRNLLNGEPLPAKATIQLSAGDTITIETPGGGGYGQPSG